MTTDEHARTALAGLKVKALSGTPSEVEVALGHFRGNAAIAAATEAAKDAMEAKQWANLAYLADFLADVAKPHPPSGGGDDASDDASDDADSSENIDILSLVEPSSLADRVLMMYSVDLGDGATLQWV